MVQWESQRDGPSLLQAWSAYIHNLEDVGRDAWNDKLIKGRDKFEKRTPTGARYKLHRLSREKGFPCLSWGDSCPCCVNNSARAPKEAYLLTSPWWRVRISTEMYEGIDNLKSLYDRAGKTSPAVLLRHRMCRVVLLNQTQYVDHQLGAGLPRIPGRGKAAPPDEITCPTSVHVAVVQQLLN
uniref:Transposase n=1 Tax=Peronospora matthiolae TaxID=2874970 RepID=A0AAV1UYW3_9STRA